MKMLRSRKQTRRESCAGALHAKLRNAGVAAKKLGVSSSRSGGVDEVAPFLMDQDVSALEKWAAHGA